MATLAALKAYDFRLEISPAGAFAQPGDDVPFTLTLERLGEEAITLDITANRI